MNKVKLFGVVFSVVLLMQIFFVSAAIGASDSWTVKASMPAGRFNCRSVAASNGMIYVIGGTGLSDTLEPVIFAGPGVMGYRNILVGVNEMYNPDKDTWATKKVMPTPRENFGLTTSQNKIYAIGGTVDNRGITGVNEVYDIMTDTWETKKPLPSDRECLDAHAVGGKIYVIGGRRSILSGGYPYFNDNLVYDIETDVWSNKTPPPIKINDYASAVIDNKIYILTYEGALYESGNSLLIYDTDTDKWSQGTSMSASVHSAVMGATTDKTAPKRLYVMSTDLDVVQIYDPATNKWSTGTQMPTERLGFSIAVLNDNIYAIGGTGVEGLSVNEMYTPDTKYTTTSSQINNNPTSSQINNNLVVTVAVIITITVVAIIIWLKTKKSL
jgi:N-acetylneuraminic acid mutarotase